MNIHHSDSLLTFYQGDVLDVLRELPAAAVQCVITSPPYWNLRDYGQPGQLGLEPTPQEYVASLVAVFDEVWRVLRDDGVVFLNIGDSYFGGGGFAPDAPSTATSKSGKYGSKGALIAGRTRAGARRADAYDTSGKAPASSQDRGCPCGSLCDVCREVYRRKSHSDDLLAPMLVASLSAPSREHTVSEHDHLPTWDSTRLASHIVPAILDLLRTPDRADEQLPVSLASMPDEFSRQLLETCWQRANDAECLVCARSLASGVQASAHTLVDSEVLSDGNQDSVSHADQQDRRIRYNDTACECSRPSTNLPTQIQPEYTTLKPKDLVGIPWRVAFALQEAGWYLRSDIIWSKPNPMPESVRDRPTKAHEYIFLLTKNARYFYDADAVRIRPSREWWDESRTTPDNPDRNDGGSQTRRPHKTDKQRGHERRHDGFNDRWDAMPKAEQQAMGANLRSVWQVATHPYPDAHFATFPPKLIEPCILAGSAEGDTVLDPFLGSGTTALVAQKFGRKCIGIDLKSDYLDMAVKRCGQKTLWGMVAD